MKYLLIFLLAILLTIIAFVCYPLIVIGRLIWDFKFQPVSNTVFDIYMVDSDNMTYGLFPLFSPSCRRMYCHKTFFHYIWYYPREKRNGLTKNNDIIHLVGKVSEDNSL